MFKIDLRMKQKSPFQTKLSSYTILSNVILTFGNISFRLNIDYIA